MHVVVITGAAGYVGAMLVRAFAQRDNVRTVIGIDKEPCPEILSGVGKCVYIESNLSDGSWQVPTAAHAPTIVIHTAWQIRELYGRRATQWKWNVEGSDAVFTFAFLTPSVEKLIHFSTASSYGAYTSNTLEHRFTEEEGFRDEQYLYAVEKKVAEEHLQQAYDEARMRGSRTKVRIVRPAAITGPRGRFMRVRFGLQSALSGQLTGSFIHRLVSLLVSWVPATPRWCRQFIHEDDVVAIIKLLAFTDHTEQYQVFNITPPGDPVRAREMAEVVGKRVLPVHPWMVRIAFWFFWHVTRGRIPTSRGGWRFYSYPIVMDGEKLTRSYGYQYRYRSGDAFRYTDGVYEEHVPPALRQHKEV
jgi:nucleoside-diphosphate-sugar epimerase